MTILSTLSTLAPYHVLAYSILFGSVTYQSFFAGIIAFKTLPYQQFSNLQSRVFPVYFSLQTLLSTFLLISKPVHFENTSKTATATLAIVFLTSLLNLLVLSPKTRQVMEARRQQEVIDGKSCKDPEPSADMFKLNQRFKKLHGVSVASNMIGFLALAFYGVVLTDGFVSVPHSN